MGVVPKGLLRRPIEPAVVSDLYDAALDPQGLRGLAEIVMAVGQGSSAAVSLERGNSFEEVATFNLPDKALQDYAAYYRRINPCIPIAMARHPGNISRFSDLIAEQDLERTEFYTDFMQVHDTVRAMGAPGIAIGPNLLLQVGVHRSRGSTDFDGNDVARLQGMVPHLKRAMQLRRRLSGGLDINAGLAALEAFAFGCVICDAAGHVLFANRAAEALEAGGIVTLTTRQGLQARNPGQSRQLATSIGATAAGGTGDALILTARDGTRVFALTTPLPVRFGGQPGHVLVTFRSESAATTLDATALQQLFPLTTAEARLALALAGGHSLARYAAEHKVSDNTLRTQIASILHKTGTENQRELVRLLGLLPPVDRMAGVGNS
ncbi:MAG: hypothetical protein IKE42_27525 [Aquamicrobium sp.]|uniref:helix-turn-helix transcriptional regulator n=1 Tax=Mesorhizobium sp. Pch-S TaxID=2082387 RepID=UPI0010108692|nr:hypothetical protein [Mesorhizobium sp. Pch-S]MBR2691623.1 hypothetical protein [Aquamicrobium sp.]QAZ42756.1 hypothetical protein C1M53_07045 [Mesorhizobium sp. Pch-S]